MRVNPKSKKIYERENWKEIFQVNITGVLWDHIPEGTPLPRFFLPVRKEITTTVLECWIFPLAPIVLMFYIARNAFWSVWADIFKWNELVREWRQKRGQKI